MLLFKKAYRTILEKKSRYIGAFILIFMSCFTFTAFNLSFPAVKKSVVEFRKTAHVEEAHFTVQNKLENISSLEKQFDIELEERTSFDDKLGQDKTVRVFKETSKINQYQVIDGRTLEKSNEIVIGADYAQQNHLQINDIMKIQNTEYKIVGFIALPDYLYVLKNVNDMINNPKDFCISVISKKDFEKYTVSAHTYCVIFHKDHEGFRNDLEKNNFLLQWLESKDNIRISGFNGDIEGNIKMGQFIPITILILTCFLMAVVFWRLVKVEYVQMGTLYALGYSKGKILLSYTFISVIISLCAGVLGTMAGSFFIEPMYALFKVQYNIPVVQKALDASVLIISIIIPILFLVPTSVFVVLNALRQSPLELIKGGANKSKVGFIEKRITLKGLSFNNRYRIKELLRNIPRSLLMFLGVLISSLLLLSGFSMLDSINLVVSDSFKKTLQYNYAYTFNQLKETKPEKGEAFSMAIFKPQNSQYKNITITVQGMEKDSHMLYLEDLQKRKIQFDKISITRALAKKMNLHEGDALKLQNKITLKEVTLKIDTIADSYLGYYIYMPIETLNTLAHYPEGSYMGIFTKEKINMNQNEIMTISSKEDMEKAYEAPLTLMKNSIFFIGLVAFVIAIIIIYIVTSLIIEENKTNISLLKVLGYNKKQVTSLIINNNTLLVLLGYMVSVPLILLVIEKLFDAITSQMNFYIPANLENVNIFIGFFVIYLAFFISKTVSGRKVNRIPLTDSLKSSLE